MAHDKNGKRKAETLLYYLKTKELNWNLKVLPKEI